MNDQADSNHLYSQHSGERAEALKLGLPKASQVAEKPTKIQRVENHICD